MGIREKLNERKHLSIGIGAITAIGAIALIVWSNSSGIPGPLKQTYYSDDDGHSYFADDISKPYPFDHNGKQAVRAFVYKGSDGKNFVAYLERDASMVARQGRNSSSASPQLSPSDAPNFEVKRPGDSKWVFEQSREGVAIQMTKPPAGSAGIKAVFP